jgi:hypothetical protein
MDLLLLVPPRHLLRRLDFRVCYERLVSLVELGVARVVGVEVL